jgi:hypothetical protein
MSLKGDSLKPFLFQQHSLFRPEKPRTLREEKISGETEIYGTLYWGKKLPATAKSRVNFCSARLRQFKTTGRRKKVANRDRSLTHWVVKNCSSLSCSQRKSVSKLKVYVLVSLHRPDDRGSKHL